MILREVLIPLLRFAGAGLILLAILHVPIARRLRWREEAARMSAVNAAVFHVHNLFICLVLVAMGLPCLFDPGVFFEQSRGVAWGTWSLCGFWGVRLWCQWCVYPAGLWQGKRFETGVHWFCTAVWLGLTVLFGLCGAWQAGWIA